MLGKIVFKEITFFSEVKVCINKVKETQFFGIFVVPFSKGSPKLRVNFGDKETGRRYSLYVVWSAFLTLWQ